MYIYIWIYIFTVYTYKPKKQKPIMYYKDILGPLFCAAQHLECNT